MELAITDNMSRPLAETLLSSLEQASSVRMAVAFAAETGVKLIRPSIEKALVDGGNVEVLIGLDFYTTEPAALMLLQNSAERHKGLSVWCFDTDAHHRGRVFHPKMYYIERRDKTCTLIVGSSNLTGGGLESNNEVSCVVTGSVGEQPFVTALGVYDRFRVWSVPFQPDSAYIDRYRRIHELAKKNQRRFEREPDIRKQVEELHEHAEGLPHAVPTQRALVMQAIRELRAAPDDWVHLDDIYDNVTRRARALDLPYDWATLRNSIRGRLNEAVLGGPGPGLFERYGGRAGRKGLYRLTDAGEEHLQRTARLGQ
jgi:HKD family nuclease